MMDLSLTDMQRNGSEEARGKLKREVEQLTAETLCGGFEVKNRLLVCLVSLYPRVFHHCPSWQRQHRIQQGDHKGTRTYTNTQADLLHTAKPTRVGSNEKKQQPRQLQVAEGHTYKKNTKLFPQ